MYLLCDWGTSSFRLFLMDDTGSDFPAKQLDSDQGVSRLPKEKQAAYLTAQVGQLLGGAERVPVYVCGMAGSGLGLIDAGYVACPADAAALAEGMVKLEIESLPEVWVVPGVSDESGALGADVMRGEETQVMGWLQQCPQFQSGRHTLCLPGTHSKWVQTDNGVITAFRTAFTGELYRLLSEQSTLRALEPASDNAGFSEGLWASQQGVPLTTAMFSARARTLLGKLEPTHANAYLSGLLIGSEIRELADSAAGDIHLIGGGTLVARYREAAAASGMQVQSHSGDTLSIAGLSSLAALRES